MKITKTEKAKIIVEALYKGSEVNDTWMIWQRKVQNIARHKAIFLNDDYQKALRILNR